MTVDFRTPARFYVAGPMRGYPEFNFPAFDSCAAQLRRLDGVDIVLNPAERDRSGGFDPSGMSGSMDDLLEAGFDLTHAMREDLKWITVHATGIVLLPGWSQSKGAMLELSVAETCGLDVLYYWPPYGNQGWSLGTRPLLGDDPQAGLSEPDFVDTYIFTNDPAAVRASFAEARKPSWDEMVKEAHERLDEVRSVNAVTGGAKGVKAQRYDLIPTGPLKQLAEIYGYGATKYADRNWERGYDWSKSYAALQRHVNQFWAGESYDDETGLSHLMHAAFHCMAMTEWLETHPELDDRPSTPTFNGLEAILNAANEASWRVIEDPTVPPNQAFLINPSLIATDGRLDKDWIQRVLADDEGQ